MHDKNIDPRVRLLAERIATEFRRGGMAPWLEQQLMTQWNRLKSLATDQRLVQLEDAARHLMAQQPLRRSLLQPREIETPPHREHRFPPGSVADRRTHLRRNRPE